MILKIKTTNSIYLAWTISGGKVNESVNIKLGVIRRKD